MIKPEADILRFIDLRLSLKNKVILQNVNGMVKSGQLLAVIGPSGSGKTTLLNALSGRLQLSSGQITLNGSPFDKKLRRNLAYVLQTDIFLPRLTLWETLYFTAMVQIPDTVSRADKKSRIDEIVKTLDLTKCLHTVVGDTFIRGLSSGERKRLNIACELLFEPDFLFLDEPTSGLDSRTARHLMEKLLDLAENQNKMIITTIHQPSSHIYHMFSSILLLVDGQTAYYGATDRALDYFSTLGFHCDKDYNPADFLLQLLKSDRSTIDNIVASAASVRSLELSYHPDAFATTKGRGDVKHLCDPDDVNVILTPDINTDPCTHVVNTNVSITERKEQFSKQKWPTTFWTQLQMLTWRNFKQSKRRMFNATGVFHAFVIAILVGLIYFQIDKSLNTFRDRMGMIFFCLIYWGFVMMETAVLGFSEDRAVVTKDDHAGMYRLSAYYTAKIVSELPQILLAPIIFFTFVHLMVSLGNITDIFVFIGVNVLNCLITQSVGHVIGATIFNTRAGIMTANTYMLLSVLLGGYFNTHFPKWLWWAKYLSLTHYPYATMVIVILGDTLPVRCNDTIIRNVDCTRNDTAVIGPEYYFQDVGIELPVFCYLAMMCFLVVTMKILGYMLLRIRSVKSLNV